MQSGDKKVDHAAELFKLIAHGSPEHRQWLRLALIAYFEGKEQPKYAV
ncbi:hypothetical protein Roomu2_00062 [Pseudomonas phage vB_PpuM-Roomu-2]|uniref:Uncharacterized protein n=1 Tax=Pseudomonas phage vB_PpuM-Roomu-2 TaxID=3132621 RepID=A0AAX4MZY0_9CAUD